MERVHFGHTTYPHIVAIMVRVYLLEQYRTSCQIEEEKWGSFLGFGDRGVADYALIGGGEFDGAYIEPMGLGGEFHDTASRYPSRVESGIRCAASVGGQGIRPTTTVGRPSPATAQGIAPENVFSPVTSFYAIAGDAFHACELARWSSSREAWEPVPETSNDNSVKRG